VGPCLMPDVIGHSEIRSSYIWLMPRFIHPRLEDVPLDLALRALPIPIGWA